MGEIRNVYNVWAANLKGRDHLKHLGLYRRIISK
jgi:hypothetical protein